MEKETTKQYRKIIHIDMDAFYASVAQRDHPELRGLPVVVGGLPEGRGGVVATASYEARKFGIRSAMPSRQALQLCPQAVFIRPDFAAYKKVSGEIRAIFNRYTDLIEPLSLDEAFLDVTADKLQINSAIEIARLIKAAISTELHLTASAGVSINKFVAKIASDMNKPDGLTFIGPSAVEGFIAELPVERFFGVGKVTAAKMKQMGLHTGADLKNLTEEELVAHYGKAGRFYYRIVRGIDERPVQPHRITKSVGAEDTFSHDLTTITEMKDALYRIAAILYERLQRHRISGKTITLKVKYSDFKQITRSRSYQDAAGDLTTIVSTAVDLLESAVLPDSKVRLLGISVSNFGVPVHPSDPGPGSQLSLF